MSTPNLNLTFTGKVFLVTYPISRHLLGRRDMRLSDDDDAALAEFLDRHQPELNSADGGRWVVTTPGDIDGFPGVCAVTRRKSETLERMALISWTEVQS